jgi:hypothetical protein
MPDCRERSAWKGALAGAAGGLAGAWLMNRFQRGLSKISSRPSAQEDDGEDATIKAAETIVEKLGDRRLTKRQKEKAGPIIHYLFGAAIGVTYGALGELTPRARIGWGMPFGAAVWLGGDEMAVPAFGWSRSPFAYSAATHASALASHLVYGATAETVRRAVRGVLGR